MHIPDSTRADSRVNQQQPAPTQQQGQPLTADLPIADTDVTGALPGRNVHQSRTHQRPTDNGDEPWEDFRTPTPLDFFASFLMGEQWQITWALALARILTKGTTKELLNKLRRKEILWGKRSGRTFCVYVHESLGQARMDKAHSELEKIKAWGSCYHPDQHPLPPKYKKHQDCPLENTSEEVLAQVLHEVGILPNATVRSLHKLIEKEGTLFGKYRDGTHALYLAERKCSEEQLNRARQLLEARSATTTLPGENNQR